MSITDELREWFKDRCFMANGWQEIHDIADRIDAEHERECKEQYACGVEHGIGASIDASMIQTHGYVELPKDADGEHIHVGDKLIDEDDKLQKPAIVKCILYNDEGCVVSDIDPRGCWYDPSLLRHYHAPTVEDVLTEFGIDWEHESDCEDRAALLKEYAAKLRLAEEDA